MKKHINLFLTTLAIICLSLTLVSFYDNDDNDNKILQLVAETANKGFPMQVDPLVRIDRLETRPNKTLVYIYTITGEIKDQETTSKLMRENIINNIRSTTNSGAKVLKDMGVTYTHIYNDMEGKTSFTINITPKDYNGVAVKRSKEEFIDDVIKLTKLQLPKKIEEGTTQTDIQYYAPDTLFFLYSVEEESLQGLEINPELLKALIIKNLQNQKDPINSRLKNENLIFKHLYKISDGKTVTAIITPEDYNSTK